MPSPRACSLLIRDAMVIVLMGVSGSGKTTVGRLLARELNWRYYEGDDFHPAANKQKMSAGFALNDADRRPWLKAIRDAIADSLERNENAVVSCSALGQAHRDRIALKGVRFVYLEGDREMIAARLEQRRGHFFAPDLLASQFELLEEPHAALIVGTAQSARAVAGEIVQRLDLRNGGGEHQR